MASKLSRDQIIVSNMLGDLIVKTGMLFNRKELVELIEDVERWRDGDQPEDAFIDAYITFIDALITEHGDYYA